MCTAQKSAAGGEKLAQAHFIAGENLLHQTYYLRPIARRTGHRSSGEKRRIDYSQLRPEAGTRSLRGTGKHPLQQKQGRQPADPGWCPSGNGGQGHPRGAPPFFTSIT